LTCRRKTAIPMREMTVPKREPSKLLQWVQRQAGVSRRKAQQLIAAGEVSVNGVIVTDAFLLLDPNDVDRLSLRGHPLSMEPPEGRIYRYHKPRGVLCSHDDPFHDNTVGKILRSEGFIGYTWVGRLDRDAEGLLLLTNDGALVHAFTHPRYEVHKTYLVSLAEMPSRHEMTRVLAEMRRGIDDEGDKLRILSGQLDRLPAHVGVTLTEGRKHEIKRLFSHFGLEVVRLVRVAVGPIELGDLPPGAIERLAAATTERVLSYARRLLTATS
jgi:23S rRNA pseudouridine2605 synthase